jgi:hypothetical protein
MLMFHVLQSSSLSIVFNNQVSSNGHQRPEFHPNRGGLQPAAYADLRVWTLLSDDNRVGRLSKISAAELLCRTQTI